MTRFRTNAMVMIATLAFAAGSPALAQATTATDLPTAEKILAKSIQAVGGKDAFEAIKSARTKGTMTTPMGDMTMEMFSAQPDKFLVLQSMPAMGMEMSAGSNGTIGWMNNPMMGGPQIIEGDELKEMRNQAQMFEMVVRMEDDFKSLETTGRETFREVDCYKVKMVDEQGDEHTVFFDAKTYLLQGLQTISTEQGQEMPVTVHFGEYKEFGDIKGFTKMTVEQMGMEMIMTIDEFEMNNVPASKFDPPEEVTAAATSRPAGN